jgi:hypothetical protein
MKTILKGWGFNVGQDFARATKDTPIELAPKEFAPRDQVIGYIAADPQSTLGFLKYSNSGKIRVCVPERAIAEVQS